MVSTRGGICPECGQPLRSALQRFATVRSPTACPECGARLAATPSGRQRIVGAVVQEGTMIAGIVAAFALASWWPLVIAVPLAALGWYGSLVWSSPLVVVTPAGIAQARRTHRVAVIAFVLLVIVAGLLSRG